MPITSRSRLRGRELGDHLAAFAFVVIGWIIVFSHASQPATVPDLARSSQAPA
jgi:hypothetical protein